MNDDCEELKEQLLHIVDAIYEDQVALIILGESETLDEETVEMSAVGATILPDGNSASLLVDSLVETMAKDATLRDIIKLAVVRYEEQNRPAPICLN